MKSVLPVTRFLDSSLGVVPLAVLTPLHDLFINGFLSFSNVNKTETSLLLSGANPPSFN
jgi:hypothetical protein